MAPSSRVEPGNWRQSRSGHQLAAVGKPAARTNSRFDELSPVAASQASQASLEPPCDGNYAKHGEANHAKPKQFSSGQRLT
jgi:hypothetical protein